MLEPTPRDCLRFLAAAAREHLRLPQADDFNKAIWTIEAVLTDAEARVAVAKSAEAKPTEAAQ